MHLHIQHDYNGDGGTKQPFKPDLLLGFPYWQEGDLTKDPSAVNQDAMQSELMVGGWRKSEYLSFHDLATLIFNKIERQFDSSEVWLFFAL